MESDLQHQVQQMNSGLTRYRSAPSSYFASFMEGDASEDFRGPLSPETERIFARFMANGTGGAAADSLRHSHDLGEFGQNSTPSALVNEQSQFLGSIKNELVHEHSNDYSSAPQNFYQNQSQTTLARQNSSLAMDYSAMNSTGLDRLSPMKMLGGNNSNLIRHSSSPAGLFADINVENGLLTRISQAGNKSMGARSPDNASFGEGHSKNFITGFPIGSWHDSAAISENITSMKRLGDDDENKISVANQNGESGNRRPPMLAHHLSMPNTSAEISAIEKFLHFQDSVPCKIRAKRGFATHPRSIAERVRRTRISERMRKLQELVPNMDKQTNTSDMLDLAVHYIKDLKQNVKTLSENRAKCTCSNGQQQLQV